MTRQEHLLVILMEECAEVAQRASKALRFGLTEIQPGQALTNAQRIEYELGDLYTIHEMLKDENEDAFDMSSEKLDQYVDAKVAKVENFLAMK